MSPQRLIDTARALVAGDKGLLAMDESNQVRLTDRQEDEVEEVDEVADVTVRCLLRAVPAAVPGIAFL
jgi:fructose-bisphosphate aldolase class 1